MLTTMTGHRASPRPTGPAVRVRGLECSYGDFRAVRGVSFDIAPGELFALLGTNGAGKTTTIEALEGFRRPTTGTVHVLGLDPRRHRRPLQGRVNAVLQESGTFADLTVAETLDLARRTTARPRDRDEVLASVHLTEQAGVRAGRLSGGQGRRLDLALAVVTRPDVLLLDEPTTGLDPEARRATWATITDLTRRGTAVLLTTHYLEEAERLADRLAVLHRGLIRVEGDLTEVLSGWGDRITFRLSAGTRGRPPAPPGTEISYETDGEATLVTCVVTGADPNRRAHRAMAALTAWAERENVVLLDLALRRASLEDVFLDIADGHEVPTLSGVSR